MDWMRQVNHIITMKKDVYWVKYGNTLTPKQETNVIDGGATYLERLTIKSQALK